MRHFRRMRFGGGGSAGEQRGEEHEREAGEHLQPADHVVRRRAACMSLTMLMKFQKPVTSSSSEAMPIHLAHAARRPPK